MGTFPFPQAGAGFPTMVLLCLFGDGGAEEIEGTPTGLSGHFEGPSDQCVDWEEIGNQCVAVPGEDHGVAEPSIGIRLFWGLSTGLGVKQHFGVLSIRLKG